MLRLSIALSTCTYAMAGGNFVVSFTFDIQNGRGTVEIDSLCSVSAVSSAS